MVLTLSQLASIYLLGFSESEHQWERQDDTRMIVVGFWGPSEWEGWQQPDLNGDLSLPMLTILYILFCNVLHCLSRITILYILFCNVLHCLSKITILYILFCYVLHCLRRITILYFLFCNVLHCLRRIVILYSWQICSVHLCMAV